MSYVLFVCCFFFFFKQKTAYEMRISDWSSDVCSSDLLGRKEIFVVEDFQCRDRRRKMDAARQGRRRDQRAAPGRDEDVDLMNRDHLTDPIEIAILVVGLEVAAVDPGLGWASIVDALLGPADEDD